MRRENGISAEILKYGIQITGTYSEFNIRHTKKKIPNSWNHAIILLLLEKDISKLCENYRGIILLDLT